MTSEQSDFDTSQYAIPTITPEDLQLRWEPCCKGRTVVDFLRNVFLPKCPTYSVAFERWVALGRPHLDTSHWPAWPGFEVPRSFEELEAAYQAAEDYYVLRSVEYIKGRPMDDISWDAMAPFIIVELVISADLEVQEQLQSSPDLDYREQRRIWTHAVNSRIALIGNFVKASIDACTKPNGPHICILQISFGSVFQSTAFCPETFIQYFKSSLQMAPRFGILAADAAYAAEGPTRWSVPDLTEFLRGFHAATATAGFSASSASTPVIINIPSAAGTQGRLRRIEGGSSDGDESTIDTEQDRRQVSNERRLVLQPQQQLLNSPGRVDLFSMLLDNRQPVQQPVVDYQWPSPEDEAINEAAQTPELDHSRSPATSLESTESPFQRQRTSLPRGNRSSTRAQRGQRQDQAPYYPQAAGPRRVTLNERVFSAFGMHQSLTSSDPFAQSEGYDTTSKSPPASESTHRVVYPYGLDPSLAEQSYYPPAQAALAQPTDNAAVAAAGDSDMPVDSQKFPVHPFSAFALHLPEPRPASEVREAVGQEQDTAHPPSPPPTVQQTGAPDVSMELAPPPPRREDAFYPQPVEMPMPTPLPWQQQQQQQPSSSLGYTNSTWHPSYSARPQMPTAEATTPQQYHHHQQLQQVPLFSGSGSRERSGIDVDAGMAEPGPSYWRGPPPVDAPPFSTLTSAAARLNDMDAPRAHGINKRRYDDEVNLQSGPPYHQPQYGEDVAVAPRSKPADRAQQNREKMQRYSARVKEQRDALDTISGHLAIVLAPVGGIRGVLGQDAADDHPATGSSSSRPGDSPQSGQQTPTFTTAAQRLNYQKRASKARKRSQEQAHTENLNRLAKFYLQCAPDPAHRHQQRQQSTASAACSLIERGLRQDARLWDILIAAEKRILLGNEGGTTTTPLPQVKRRLSPESSSSHHSSPTATTVNVAGGGFYGTGPYAWLGALLGQWQQQQQHRQ